MKRKLMAAAGTIAIAVAVAGSAQATETAGPSLTGTGTLDFGEYGVAEFTFDARGTGPAATGTFRYSHEYAGEHPWFEGRIDCLVPGGPVTVVTGVVTTTSGDQAEVGRRKGFTVYDHGRSDRLGFSWGAGGIADVPPCLGTAPFWKVASGDFRVR